MNTIKKIFSNLFTTATSENDKIYREWDAQRSRALSSAEVSEIDAIFARHL
jgi:hypothetical protein